MTEDLRKALLDTIASAKVFVVRADDELIGGPSSPRQEAQDELEADLARLHGTDVAKRKNYQETIAEIKGATNRIRALCKEFDEKRAKPYKSLIGDCK